MSQKETPYSNLKIFAHLDKMKELEKGNRVVPIYIRIKPTNKCNHNCSYCHYKNPYLILDEYTYSDFIPYEKMKEIICDIGEIGVKAVTFSGGGEPLLYPYIDETMQMVLDQGIELSIITNGILLMNKSADILRKAKWVRISLDADNDEDYCQGRGIKKGSFKKLCANIKKFAEIKEKKCELGINFVVSQENYTQVYAVGRMMKELGVNHIKFAPLCSNQTEEYHAPFKDKVIEQIKKLKKEMQQFSFKIIDLYSSDFERQEKIFKRTYEKCYVKEFVCVIAANAKIYYCHDKAYLSHGVVADLNQVSFKEAWFSDEVTEKFKKFNAYQICQHHCVYDERNHLLNSYFSLDKNHINFI